MSTSRRPSLSGPSKKISSWVRPGVCEVRARLLRPVSALMREDLPTLERPAKAISSPAIGGNVSIDGAAQVNCQSPAKSFLPRSISFASMSAVMRRLSPPSSRATRSNPFHSETTHELLRRGACHRAGPRGPDPLASRNDDRRDRGTLRLRLRLLPGEGALEIVQQLHLYAVAAHDEALLDHRQQIVPGPVDHQPRREARQHEGE